jgi:hypothetical protein
MRRLAALYLLIFAGIAPAWDGWGHMTVAAIAYQNLTPTAKTKIAVLLKKNPNYKQWVTGVSKQNQPQIAFLMAATWPDAIKNMKGYTNDGNTPSGPDASRNIGYSDKLQHRYWHFIDTPFSPDGTALIEPVAPNAQTQIAVFRTTLGSPSASAALKSYDLVWLLHLVGDVHQPLHATSRFDAQEPKGDAGGNDVALCAKPCKDELHAFWDDVLGVGTDPAATAQSASAIPPADPGLAAVADETKWVNESFQAAKDSVYIDPIGIGPGPFILTDDYKANAAKVATVRVALAGTRLANLLNAALK